MKYPKIKVVENATENQNEVVIQAEDIVELTPSTPGAGFKAGARTVVEMAAGGGLGIKRTALWLNSDYDWQIVRDRCDCLALVCLKKNS